MSLRWEPDTCGCIFQVEDDWLSAEVINACPLHAGSDPFTAALDHNKMKNRVAKVARELAPDLLINTWVDQITGDVKVKVVGKKSTAPIDDESIRRHLARSPQAADEQQKTKLKNDLKAHYGKDIDVS